MTQAKFLTLAPVISVIGAQEAVSVRRVYCVGRNYVAHIREMQEGDEKDPPFFFQKPTDSVVPNKATVPYPAATNDLQFEAELTIVIGKSGQDIAPKDALAHVYGYAVGIDLTRRDRQFECRDMRHPWEAGKSFDCSAPIGNVTMQKDAGKMDSGRISLSVNGDLKQDNDISNMIWGVADIISQLSAQYTLMPGDIIMTGTPDGVGPVKPGDKVVASVDGLADLSIEIVARKLEGKN